MRQFLFPALTLPLALVISQPTVASAQARSELAGTWVLNRELTDDLEAFEREADKGVPKALGSGPIRVAAVRPRTPTERRGGFGWPRGFDPRVQHEVVATLSHPAERLAITLNADTLSLAYADSTPLGVIVDGKKSRRVWRDGMEAEIRATWKDGELRIEQKLLNELKITERYSFDPRTRQLVVITTAEDAIPSKLEVRYVYSPASAR